jgi:hypothetical protein
VWSVDSENKIVRLEAQRLFSFEGHVFLKAPDSAETVKVISRPLSNFRTGMEIKEVE